MFAAQWFDKYTEKDGSAREQRQRRQSLVAIHFNDSDEDVEPFQFDEQLGTITET